MTLFLSFVSVEKIFQLLRHTPESSPFQYHPRQVYALASGHDDNEVDQFYQQLQEIFIKYQRGTFGLYKGIGMLKLGRMHRQPGQMFVDPTVMMRQMGEISNF